MPAIPRDRSAHFMVSAVVLRDAHGRIVTVRKAGTSRFMLPGGKPEPGESAAQAAIRKCADDLASLLEHHVLPTLAPATRP